MIGPALNGLTAAAAVWLGAACLTRLRAEVAAMALEAAAIRARAAELRRRLAEARGAADLPAFDAQPAAWLTPEALDAAALNDVVAAVRRLRTLFGDAPADEECAAMLLVFEDATGAIISGDMPAIRLVRRATAAAKRRKRGKRPNDPRP